MRLIDVKRKIISALAAIDGKERESDLILSRLYDLETEQLHLKLFDDVAPRAELDAILSRRAAGEPLEYILGKTVFYGLDFIVSPDCLIPQADTEIVVDTALTHIGGARRFLDLCTGSGCIAIALSKESGAVGTAVDISDKALDIAAKNAKMNGVSDKIKFVCADVMSDTSFFVDEKFDLVVSNPPYVKTADIPSLPCEVRHEPYIALDGGDDGLTFYRRIIAIAPSMLNEGGSLVLEVGYDTSKGVCALLENSCFEYTVIKDYGGIDRCVAAHIDISRRKA